MATVTTYGQLPEAEHSVQLRKAVIASTIGTAIEWYDFFLYGTAAGLVFGKLFFPNEDPYSALFSPSAPTSLASPPAPSGRRSSAIMATASAAKPR
jgi:hypothetical protein